MKVELPFPPPSLSPNARVHRMTQARAAKKYRRDCHYAAMSQGLRRMVAEQVMVTMTFHPPVKRAHDDDNLVGRMKTARDALADVTGIDDRNFRMGEPIISEPCPPHGKVIVELEAMA